LKKRKLIIDSSILALGFLFYLLACMFNMETLSNIISPLVLFFSAYHIYRTYRNTYDFRINWLFLGLACLSFGLGEFLWAYYDIVLKIDPREVYLMSYIYLIPNICIAAAAMVYFIIYLQKWNMVQLALDFTAVMSIGISLLWVIFLKENFSKALMQDANSITTLLYVLSDFIAVSSIFIMFISVRRRKITNPLKVISISIFLYAGSDLVSSYQALKGTYEPNSITDIIFIGALILVAYASMLELYNPIKQAPKADLSLPENVGKNSRIRLLILLPLFLFLVGAFKLNVILQFLVIIVFHQLLSGYVQNTLINEHMLKQEKILNDTLEAKIAKRTEELTKLNTELERITREDATTGLNNRRYFIDELDKMIKNAQGKHSVVLLYMDLDRFKAINDSFGHDMGDKVLVQIANRLNGLITDSMLLARLGGDEFVIAIEGQLEKSIILIMAKDIISLCNKPIIIEPYQFRVMLSLGISMYPKDAIERNMLMKNAEIAMYYAKSENNKHYSFYDSIVSEKIQRKHEIELLLRKADYDKEFELYFQPQFSIPNEELVGAEALLRWKSPNKGFISPGEFIPIAEECGAIVDIGYWVINKALTQIYNWSTKYERQLRIGINISPKQVDSINFLDNFQNLIREKKISPSWIDVEITESSAMKSEIAMEELFNALARMGVLISIDDFGTGYSSLSYIKRFDIDRIKIAKELVDGICDNNSDEQIIKAIIMMTKAMGLKTIAEGVEKQEQLDKLIELRCEEIQGYIFDRPIPASEFEEKYLKNRFL
jgi:diguanylate cyclase (GGDEF)-like protein